MRLRILILPIISLFFLLGACATTDKTARQSPGEILQNAGEPAADDAQGDASSGDRVKPFTSQLTLSDYLRKVSGVLVMERNGETTVRIRGINSLEGNNFPLFVINGSQVGHIYAAAEQSVDVDDIEIINVLKGNQASSRYGSRGTAGVIEIFTKE
ncbi:MAG: TonB-dependent receptor plug domain-containing protein [Bacteroidetes bacterium]|jgi:TonB-dependent SusC/RagA subfamily outer membrane receptor|nr:TonB-dependent receptor plug domain-containing protein [Bacteroidota bacterium]